MSSHNGEQLATLLDKGLNILSVLPDDYIMGIGASYFGEGGGMLSLEQSPPLGDAHQTRLRILGVIAGMASYGDENRSAFALSNNVSLPDGTHVQLKELEPTQGERANYQLPDGALEASYDITNFLHGIAGNLWTARLGFETGKVTAVTADVSGVFTTDEMRATYLETIGHGVIVGEYANPTSAKAVASIIHTVLTPTRGQVINFSMSDHRPGNREEMLHLRQG